MHPGPNMKTLRELHGKTLEDVARRVGISVSMLSLVEREKHGVSKAMLKKWTKLFYIDERVLSEGVLAYSVFVPSQHGAGHVSRSG